MTHQKRNARIVKLKFLKDYTYDSFPADKDGKPLGKVEVTVKKGTVVDVPYGPAIYLKQDGFAKEVTNVRTKKASRKH